MTDCIKWLWRTVLSEYYWLYIVYVLCTMYMAVTAQYHTCNWKERKKENKQLPRNDSVWEGDSCVPCPPPPLHHTYCVFTDQYSTQCIHVCPEQCTHNMNNTMQCTLYTLHSNRCPRRSIATKIYPRRPTLTKRCSGRSSWTKRYSGRSNLD